MFLSWTEVRPVKQDKDISKRVSDWLTVSARLRDMAKPMAMLHGWFIKVTSKLEVPMFAAGQIRLYFPKQTTQQQSAQQISQIVYQADQKTRDLGPGEVNKPPEIDTK